MRKHYLLIFCLIMPLFLSAQAFHDTQGKLEVSNGGQAVFTLPIAMPPSLHNVGPVINLTYSSGQAGGIVGQGWGISSISNISRIATRLDIDGFVDGVDFDENDKLAIDGQRLLLKSGAYWANGSIYETEVQSNVKIELKKEGAITYFIVSLPDGSRNFYGNFNGTIAQDKTAFYISRFDDVKGNFIIYNYFEPFGKSLCISDIQFSANIFTNTQPLNKIQFYYDYAQRAESGYVYGEKIEKVEILKSIQVTTNNLVFKRYDISHIVDSQLGYQRVSKIQEFNSAGEAANPIEFTYDATISNNDGSEIVKTFTNNFDFNNTKTAGDFDGDGRLDFATDSQLFTKIFNGTNGTSPIAIAIGGDERTRIVATTLKNGKLNQKQSFIVANETVNAINFNYYSLNENGSNVLLDNTKSISFDNSISNISSNPISPFCTVPTKKSSNKYLEGDFNGDGLSEVLISSTIDEKFSLNAGISPSIPYYFYTCVFDTDGESQTILDYFIVNLNSNDSNILGSKDYVKVSNSNILNGDKRIVMDFNSDGKSDILIINKDKSYKVVGIKTFDATPWMEFEIIGQGVLDDYNESKPLLFGDYNGDSKTDIMLPVGNGDSPGQVYWNIFFSNPKLQGGTLFEKETYPIVEYWPNSGTFFELSSQSNNYYALDVNKDGKTDILKVWRNHFKPKWTINNHDTNWRITTHVNNIGNSNSFSNDYTTPCQYPGTLYQNCDHWSDSPEMVVPIVSNYKHADINNEVVLIRKHTNELTYINFKKDFTRDNNLIKISQSNGAIVDEIKYKALETNPRVNNGFNSASDFYSSTNELTYPFVELKQMPTTSLVDKHTNTVMGVSRFQDFKYQGFVAKLNGIGAIGFKKTMRSSWYNNNTGKKTLAVTINDPLKRGAIIRTYSQLVDINYNGAFNDESNKLSELTNEFIEIPNANKYIILFKKQTSKDFLTNVITTSETEYTPDYFLPRLITSKNYVGTV